MVRCLLTQTSRYLAATGVLLSLLAIADNDALAGNQDSYFLGDQAALAGGAVVAVTHDAGAVFYNPAGLGENDRIRLDVSANAYVLRLRTMDRIVQYRTSVGETSQGLDGTAMFGVPSSLVYVRALRPGVSAGVGIYITDQDELKLTADLPTSAEPPFKRVSFERRLVRYHLGPALGIALSPSLRVGASLLGSYETLSQRVDSALFVASGDREILTRLSDFTTTKFGVEPALGIQYNATSFIRLGLALRGPRFLFFGSRRELSSVLQPSASTQWVDVQQTETKTSEDARIIAPPRILGGVALDGNAGWLSVEADFAPGLATYGSTPARSSVWNVRAGGLLKLSSRWRAGAGLYTDRSYAPTPQAFPDYHVSYYGATLGVQTRHSILLADNQGEDADPAEEDLRRKVGHSDSSPALYFGTTLALRYAMGVGEAAVLDLATTPGPGAAERRSVTWHEIGIHLGTGLYF